MKRENIVKIQRVGKFVESDGNIIEYLSIGIPRKIVKAASLKKGDYLKFSFNNKDIIVEKVNKLEE